jgi:hypothetical protein
MTLGSGIPKKSVSARHRGKAPLTPSVAHVLEASPP